MRRVTGLVAIAAAVLVVTSANAGDKEKEPSCCAVRGTMDCAATYAKLSLSLEQKAKMDALVEKCKGAGCTKESTDAFIKSAESILSKEQMTAFKAECNKLRDKNDPKA
jgi:hypothetical protein